MVLQITGPFALKVVGFFLMGVACVVGVALAFYVVGRGEDRERDDGSS